jgi:ADP-ribose pyrophosphatase
MAKRKERLVYKGEIFKIYQWRQKMFDGTYKTFERVERPSTVEVIAVVGDRIATAMQSQPGRSRFKSLLGGRVDEGERPLEAAKRELMEEAGMAAKRWKLVKSVTQPANKVSFGAYLYAALDCKKVAKQNLDNGERIKVKFITLKELLGWSVDTARIGPHTVLYFTKLRYNKKARERFARRIGL